jgi:hypothetical protein
MNNAVLPQKGVETEKRGKLLSEGEKCRKRLICFVSFAGMSCKIKNTENNFQKFQTSINIYIYNNFKLKKGA